ncbi:MAG TPA: hypothetical protein VMV38_02260 [Candidatus Paceibacterota bacterium]|nr:hypothetical protein [Candidatus Paceibacterota bacterium]
MSRNHGNSEKFRASSSVDIDEVIKIVLGISKNCTSIRLIAAKKNKGVAGGTPKVTFVDIPKGFLLKVRQLNGEQEVRILCRNSIQEIRLQIARSLRERDIPICFRP